MKFFVDTADVAEIRDLSATGLLDGVTTNPSLMAKSGRDVFEVLAEICEAVDGPVSAEVTATDSEGMIAEGERLAAIADNICVKVPLTWDGLKACRALTGAGRQVNVTLCFSANQALPWAGLRATRAFSDEGIRTNVTLCFSAAQAMLAAKAGASFISPFVGRLDDIGLDGMELIDEIVTIYANYPALSTEVLVASVRTVNHVAEAARLGADVATVPPGILRDLVKHPLTDKGLAAFLEDWKKTGQSILPG